MKQLRILGVVLMAGLFLAGCAATAYVEKDESVNLSKYQTFAWVDTKDSQDDTVKTKISDLAERNIRQAVNTELAKAGWKEVKNKPDLLLTYDVLVERGVKEDTNPIYTQPVTRWFYNPYTRRWNSIYYPSRYAGYEVNEREVREGTITISLIDARSNKTIWQGWSTDEVNSRNLTSREIQSAVRSIFRKFDVAKN
jgi:hypothetical protein